MDPVRDLILIIAQALVDHPNQVFVNDIDGGQTVIYELTVSRTDIGKVIGKNGRTVDAIRTILGSIAGKNRKKFIFEIMDHR